ncbi:MAG: hypothetical protein ACLUIQ_03155 [Dialister invisus]
MTKEERAEKWSRGIPEMECLTQQEKEEICRRLFQLLVLTGYSGLSFSFLSLEDPAFFDVLNHSADKVNEIHKNVHSMAKRQGAAVMSLPYVLPLVLPIVIPALAVVYFLKKPLLRREAGKLSQRWRLETDVNTTVQFASEDIKKTMELLQKDDVQYLILMPPAPVMGSLFMQTAHDEGICLLWKSARRKKVEASFTEKRGRLGSRYCMRCKITGTGISFPIPPAGKSCTHLKIHRIRGVAGIRLIRLQADRMERAHSFGTFAKRGRKC